jgi:hypothetical protein
VEQPYWQHVVELLARRLQLVET